MANKLKSSNDICHTTAQISVIHITYHFGESTYITWTHEIILQEKPLEFDINHVFSLSLLSEIKLDAITIITMIRKAKCWRNLILLLLSILESSRKIKHNNSLKPTPVNNVAKKKWFHSDIVVAQMSIIFPFAGNLEWNFCVFFTTPDSFGCAAYVRPQL